MAAAIIHEHKPQVMFVHFPDCDRVGHAIGWGSPDQVKTLGKTDAALEWFFLPWMTNT